MDTPRYFRPEIKDFWPGCVFYSKVKQKDSNPFAQTPDIPAQYLRLTFTADGFQSFDISRGGIDCIKVPEHCYFRYLDSEQILLTGRWNNEYNSPVPTYQNRQDLHVEWFRHKERPEYLLSFVEEYSALGVYCWFDSGEHGVIQGLIFSGTVRDINRFNLIMELLDIEEPATKMLTNG